MVLRVRLEHVAGLIYAFLAKLLHLPPMVSGTAIIIESGKILLVKNDGGLRIPGGLIKFGERVCDGTIREAEEETGYKVELSGTVKEYVQPISFKTIMRAHEAKIVSGKARASREGKPIWVKLSDLPEEMPENYREVIHDFTGK